MTFAELAGVEILDCYSKHGIFSHTAKVAKVLRAAETLLHRKNLGFKFTSGIVIMRFIETGCSVQPRQVRGPSDEMRRRKTVMSVYKMIHVVGTSPTSWEEAAKNAVEEASKHLHDLRISEVEQLDMRLEDGKVVEYRARVHVSFRYKGE